MKKLVFAVVMVLFAACAFAQAVGSEPTVSAVTMEQSGGWVIVRYNLSYDNNPVNSYITLVISDDNGANFKIVPHRDFLVGDVGSNILPGSNKEIKWHIYGQYAAGLGQGILGDSFKARVIARRDDDNLGDLASMVLVDGDFFYRVVTIRPFYIGRHEVTQKEYQAVMGYNPSHFVDDEGYPLYPNPPVEQVTWYDAIEYCNRRSILEGLTPCYSYGNDGTDPDDWYAADPEWNTVRENHMYITWDWEANGYRLPTEAEWHHAANSAINPGPFNYSGSNDINAVCWYVDNSNDRTHTVGTKSPNNLLIYDMSGNVLEWVWDIYGDTFPSGNDNPKGAVSGLGRVHRGGSYAEDAEYCTLAHRSSSTAVAKAYNIGFRICRNSPHSSRYVVVPPGYLQNSYISKFFLGRFEITQESFKNVMGYNNSYFKDDEGNPHYPNLPVETVSWFGAIEYCNRRSIQEGRVPCYSYTDENGPHGTNPDYWYIAAPGWNLSNDNHTNVDCNWAANGYRLPTEAEWEYAASGAVYPSPYIYAGSDIVDIVAWYIVNSDSRTHIVGTKAPNTIGTYDMSGNVWEWCWDIYGTEFPTGANNPTGPETGEKRIVRGGSWMNTHDACMVTNRGFGDPGWVSRGAGFRCVRRAD